MKQLYMVTILLLFIGCAAIPIPFEDRQSEQIIEPLNNKSKNELFEICLEWLVTRFGDSEDVLELNDKKNGRIIGKGYMVVTKGRFYNQGVHFIFTINIKDNRIRMRYEDYTYQDSKPINTSDRWIIMKAEERNISSAMDLKKFIMNYGSDNKW